jgi:hypothetical protein
MWNGTFQEELAARLDTFHGALLTVLANQK